MLLLGALGAGIAYAKAYEWHIIGPEKPGEKETRLLAAVGGGAVGVWLGFVIGER
jgi:hypothetical protein